MTPKKTQRVKAKDFSFKAFKKFLTEKCYDEKLYGDGKYDRKIYSWFRVGKPIRCRVLF